MLQIPKPRASKSIFNGNNWNEWNVEFPMTSKETRSATRQLRDQSIGGLVVEGGCCCKIERYEFVA